MTLQLIAQSWAKEAACAHTDPTPFYPTRTTRKVAIEAAKALCRQCPVASDCLADALDRTEEFGIWGGLDEYERRDLKRRSRRRA